MCTQNVLMLMGNERGGGFATVFGMGVEGSQVRGVSLPAHAASAAAAAVVLMSNVSGTVEPRLLAVDARRLTADGGIRGVSACISICICIRISMPRNALWKNV